MRAGLCARPPKARHVFSYVKACLRPAEKACSVKNPEGRKGMRQCGAIGRAPPRAFYRGVYVVWSRPFFTCAVNYKVLVS